MDEFFALYEHWLTSYNIADSLRTSSSKEINEVFTLFLIIEEGPNFQMALAEKANFMLEILNLQHSRHVSQVYSLSDHWQRKAELIFNKLDIDNKCHLNSEDLQFLSISLILPELRSIDPIMLRKQSGALLQEMSHTNGIVSLKSFKNFLIQKSWTKLSDLESLDEKLEKVASAWYQIRQKILLRELDSLSECSFLPSNKHFFPSIWSQSIILSLQSSLKSNSYKDWEKLYKFLRFSGWALGNTPSASTKGECFIKGTYLREIPEFAVYLMSNFLEFEGQFHTSVSLASINQQSICRVSGDSRFQAIHKSLVNFDRIMNLVLYEIISAYNPREMKPVIIRTASVSLNSTAKTVNINRSISPKIVPRINLGRNKPVSVSVKLIAPSKSQKTISRNSSTRSTRSKSPILGRLESYDKVMERLHK